MGVCVGGVGGRVSAREFMGAPCCARGREARIRTVIVGCVHIVEACVIAPPVRDVLVRGEAAVPCVRGVGGAGAVKRVQAREGSQKISNAHLPTMWVA